jgi:hypothetical protein
MRRSLDPEAEEEEQLYGSLPLSSAINPCISNTGIYPSVLDTPKTTLQLPSQTPWNIILSLV